EQACHHLGRLAQIAADRLAERLDGLCARAHAARQPEAGLKQRALEQARQQAGLDERRFAGAGWPDHIQAPPLAQILEHLLDLALATVEEARVLGAEGNHAGIRAREPLVGASVWARAAAARRGAALASGGWPARLTRSPKRLIQRVDLLLDL